MTLIERVWDETAAVLAARRGVLALLALGLFVPPVLHAGWLLATTPPDRSPSPAPTALFALLVAIVGLWSQVAIVAVAGLPATGGEAMRVAWRRLLPALGVGAVVALGFGLLLAPMVVILVRGGADLQAMSGSDGMALSAAAGAAATLYFLLFLVVAVIVGARLILVTPAVALERRGLGAVVRSWRLTRGLTWRIIGVTLLFVLVIGIAVLAAQAVAGVAAALIAGSDSAVPAFVAAVAGAAVTAALGVVAIVFTARLWHALEARRPA